MISIYIHVPFCRGKCRYCGFYSTPYRSDVADAYLDALNRELIAYKSKLNPIQVETMYLGGGTPSILSPEQFERLFSIIHSAVDFAPHTEITVESNPDSISSVFLSLLKDHGVNRLSIGVQSFSDEILGWLGRPHTARQAREALALSRTYGFDNINIDLMYGIPGLSSERWKDAIKIATDFRPEHIAAYSLSLDEGSILQRQHDEGTVHLPDDGIVICQYEDAIGRFESSGYRHYEISNFCLPSFECRHNMNYWQRGEYLGLGPAAWTFLDGKRTMNIADTSEYISRIHNDGRAFQFEETPTREEAITEALALGLRMSCGVDLNRISTRFGDEVKARLLEKLRSLDWTGFYSLEETTLRLSHRGRLFANDAVARILT